MTTGGSAPRALLITKTDPAVPRDGGALRVAAIVELLREAAWRVDVVPVRTALGTARRDLPAARGSRELAAVARVVGAGARAGSASVARWIDPRVAGEVARLRARHHHDIGILEFSQLLVYRPLLAGLPVLLDLHNLEAELLANYAGSTRSRARRLIARWESARLRRLESARSLRGVDAITAVSERDTAHLAASLGAGAVTTAPNGVSDEAFTVARAPRSPQTVVFVAHLGWQPNVDAARWLVERAWPDVHRARPEAELHLIGRSPAPAVRALHGLAGVSVHGDVPSPLPHLAAATVATAPLQAAGGTRLKILEALATGAPVVATPQGAMGLEHLEGDHLRITEHPAAFAAALLRVMDSTPGERAARQLAEPYRWRTALRPLLGAADALRGRNDVQ